MYNLKSLTLSLVSGFDHRRLVPSLHVLSTLHIFVVLLPLRDVRYPQLALRPCLRQSQRFLRAHSDPGCLLRLFQPSLRGPLRRRTRHQLPLGLYLGFRFLPAAALWPRTRIRIQIRTRIQTRIQTRSLRFARVCAGPLALSQRLLLRHSRCWCRCEGVS